MLSTAGRAMLLAKVQELKEQENQWNLLRNNFDFDEIFVRTADWMLGNFREQIAALESVIESGWCE